jgi:prepilin-type N-terminal cleavage/methylation domain-containing protein
MPAAACRDLPLIRSVHSSIASLSTLTRSRSRGFTLLEVLLTIAIIALVASVLIGGTARLLSDQPVSVDDVFWKAVREARKTALKTEHDIRLKFDKEKKQFLIIDGIAPAALAADGLTREEIPLKAFPIAPDLATDLTVDFLGPSTKGGSLILIAGVALESNPVQFVTFYSDGTCTAFRLQISRGGSVHTLSIDPWTCAPVLPPPDPNAPSP